MTHWVAAYGKLVKQRSRLYWFMSRLKAQYLSFRMHHPRSVGGLGVIIYRVTTFRITAGSAAQGPRS
jgi:hypothetical protein